jgi:triacylglycerol lipase
MSSSRHLIDPELFDLLDRFGPLDLSMDTLAAVREAMHQAPGAFVGEGGAVQTTRDSAPGPAGAPDVGLLIHRPLQSVEPLPCILHMHGGGFVFGSPWADAAQHRLMVAELFCCIVSVDYRLAPETPFPGAIEDCYAALAWLAAQASALNIDPSRIGVMGESAGGGLAAALALMARDRGGFSLAFQHLIYPMLDDRTGLFEAPSPFAGAFVWTLANNSFGWRALVGEQAGKGGVSCYAAPARAEDLSGLPATFISTGALDLLAEESLDYARRLIRAGVPVELHVYPGAFHGFDYDLSAAVSIRARRDSWSALGRSLRPKDLPAEGAPPSR